MKKFGLGDLAYYVFRPVVYGIDAVWGTDLRHCNVCKARRKRWNAVPYSGSWTALILTVTLWAVLIHWRRAL